MNNETNDKVWLKYMPSYVDLHYVDYSDSLNEHLELLQKCVEKNSTDSLYDEVFDWWEYAEEPYLKEIERKMEKDDLLYEFVANINDIEDWLREHDKSDPVNGLLRNTSDQTMFYSLGVEVDGAWTHCFMYDHYDDEANEQSAKIIRDKLGIADGTDDAKLIMELCEEASYGGELRIYFKSDVQSLITEHGPENDWNIIHFKGKVCVAVWDNCNGAGYHVFVNIDKKFKFVRENLQISACAEKYDYESSCGMCGYWLDDCDKPTFSFDKRGADKVKISESLSKERVFKKVYSEGGCSFDDNVMDRHHGVYYRNEVPCGWVCPHCGRVWLD